MSLNCPTYLYRVVGGGRRGSGVRCVSSRIQWILCGAPGMLWCVSGLYGGAGYLCAVTHARGS